MATTAYLAIYLDDPEDLRRLQSLVGTDGEPLIDHRGVLDGARVQLDMYGVHLKFWWFGTNPKTKRLNSRRTATEIRLVADWLPQLLRNTGYSRAAIMIAQSLGEAS